MRTATSCAWFAWFPPALRGQAAAGDEPGPGDGVGAGVGLGVGFAVWGAGVGVGGREADDVAGWGVGDGRDSDVVHAPATRQSARRIRAKSEGGLRVLK